MTHYFRQLTWVDRCLIDFSNLLGLSRHPAPHPGEHIAPANLSAADKARSVQLLRISHCGEICAQALYKGQALFCKDAQLTEFFHTAAHEETQHLQWCHRRLQELGGRPSLLNAFFYGGALLMGTCAGLVGERWNLGFMAETEKQVEVHLDDQLHSLPTADARSRAILAQMKADEARHAEDAFARGGATLPRPVQHAMAATASLMKVVTRYL